MLIALWDTINNGYNITLGGEGSPGIRYFGEDNHFYGRHHTEETKKKISEHHADFRGENGPLFGKNGDDHPSSIAVVQLDAENNFICRWPCIRQAGEELHIDSSAISKCCRGKIKICGGFHWQYEKEYVHMDVL